VDDPDDAGRGSTSKSDLLRLVDLDVVPVAVARPRCVRGLEPAPDVRRHATGAREAVHLLEREHRVGVSYA
jgi:hypothetical protein